MIISCPRPTTGAQAASEGNLGSWASCGWRASSNGVEGVAFVSSLRIPGAVTDAVVDTLVYGLFYCARHLCPEEVSLPPSIPSGLSRVDQLTVPGGWEHPACRRSRPFSVSAEP